MSKKVIKTVDTMKAKQVYTDKIYINGYIISVDNKGRLIISKEI